MIISKDLVSEIYAIGGKISHKNSRGENLVKWALDKLNIKYEQEKIIHLKDYDPAKKTHWGRADFYIKSPIPTIIEYNGKQHYEYSPELQGTEYKYSKQQWRDIALKEYCKSNGIRLINIKYSVGPKDIIPKLKSALQNPDSSDIS